MRRFIAIALCLATATAVADDVRRTLDASSDGRVAISNPAGSIEVKGWNRDQVEVTGDLGRGVDELVFERSGNEVKVVVKSKGHSGRGTSSDLQVRVPHMSSVKVNSVSADISTNDVRGAQRLQTVSGDIDTFAFDSDIDVETVSGDISIGGSGAALRITAGSVSGDIDIVGLSGEVETSSVSGDLVVADGEFSRASMNTTNGDIVFRARLLGKGRLDVETINGDVDIDFLGELSARFDIETFNGDIRNCFGPEAQRTSRYAPGRELNFTEGSGSSRVTVRTLNGDLQMCRD